MRILSLAFLLLFLRSSSKDFDELFFKKGTEHWLGVIEVRPGEPQILCDTFSFENKSAFSVNVQSMWTARPDRFRFTRHVSSGSEGAVYYCDTVHRAMGLLEETQVRTEMRMDRLLPVTLVTRYFLIDTKQVLKRYDNGRVQRAEQPYRNGAWIRVLQVHPNGMPAAIGDELAQGRSRINRWTYWNEQGEQIADSLFVRHTPLSVQPSPGTVEDSLEIRAHVGGQWIPVRSSGLVLEPDCFLPDSADSIRVSNRYGSAVVPIHYPRGIGEGLQVHLLKTGQRYYYFHRNRMPIDFLQNSFYVECKMDSGEGRHTSLALIEELKHAFPGGQWQRHPYRNNLWRIDLPMAGVVAASDLARHPLVEHVFNLVGGEYPLDPPSYLNGYVYFQLAIGVQPDSIDRILTRHGFKRSAASSPEYFGAQYDAKLVTDQFLDDYNRLAEELELSNSYPMIMAYIRQEPE